MLSVDLHCHLLPGVDDGPQTIEETVELARAVVADGTGAVVATPHLRSDFLADPSVLPDLMREVQDRLREERIPLAVHQGAELGHEMVGRLTQPELELISLGPAGARWLLLETPFADLAGELHAATDELRDRGFGVVLAHPERGTSAEGRDDAIEREVEHGSLLQVNTWSILGRHGDGARAAARRFMAAGVVDVLASDAHPGWRAPSLRRGAMAAAAAGLGPAVVRRLVAATPARLLQRGYAAPSLAPLS